jgi:dihydroorotate dehydrogenase electron transfer subunit
MKENRTEIALNEPVGARAFRLRFPVDWPSYEPGQFVMVEVPGGGATFLRRPFGIAGLEGGLCEICCKVVGRGTEALSHASVGTPIRVTGPCGKGFAVPAAGATAILVAGGYGIGPLYGLAKRLTGAGRRAVIYYGAKRPAELLYLDRLEGVASEVCIATEDGGMGSKGMITRRLEAEIGSIERPALFACGPEGLVREVARIGIAQKIFTQVSMDAYMACGIGVCMGCACKDANGNFVRTCREGPVFDARELKWDK